MERAEMESGHVEATKRGTMRALDSSSTPHMAWVADHQTTIPRRIINTMIFISSPPHPDTCSLFCRTVPSTSWCEMRSGLTQSRGDGPRTYCVRSFALSGCVDTPAGRPL
eukprot:scaffold2003_cov139-Cylindrotheca_fusiformis.AAC.25